MDTLRLQEELKLQLNVFNDFAAVANAIPVLKDDARAKIGGGRDDAEGPIAVIGPGTGLGVAGLVRTGNEWLEIPGEGGHATMPAVTREESKILDLLRLRWYHISAERVLSGDGLVNIYQALCTLNGGVTPNFTDPAEITSAAIPASEQVPPNWLCVRAFEIFCAMLGTVAADVALTFGAASVYVAGGILPKFPKQFRDSAFRKRFEQKDRLSSYLISVSTYLMLHQAPRCSGLIELTRGSSGNMGRKIL
jgi:glucokinase